MFFAISACQTYSSSSDCWTSVFFSQSRYIFKEIMTIFWFFHSPAKPKLLSKTFVSLEMLTFLRHWHSPRHLHTCLLGVEIRLVQFWTAQTLPFTFHHPSLGVFPCVKREMYWDLDRHLRVRMIQNDLCNNMSVAAIVIWAIHYYMMTFQPLCHRGTPKEFIAFFLSFVKTWMGNMNKHLSLWSFCKGL